MNTEAALEHMTARVNEGWPSDRVIAELVEMGTAEETGRELLDRVLAMRRDAQARDIAVLMLKQGKSAAKVEEALVSSGVEQAASAALVKELFQLHGDADAYEARLKRGNAERIEGSFAIGFACGFFGGFIALMFSYWWTTMGSQTRRGVRYGFATSLALYLLWKYLPR